jgi:hypothetical protein
MFARRLKKGGALHFVDNSNLFCTHSKSWHIQWRSQFDAQKTCSTRTASARIAITMQHFDAKIGKVLPILLELSYIFDGRNIFHGTRIADNPFFNCIQIAFNM